jgi:hypothetical protein
MRYALTALAICVGLVPLLWPVDDASWKIRLLSFLVLLPLATFIGTSSLMATKGMDRAKGASPANPRKFKKMVNVAVIATAILFALGIIAPIEFAGTETLMQGKTSEVSGRVEDNHVVLGGWFIMQRLSLDGGSKDLYYFLCADPIKVGGEYQFQVMDNFPLILQHKRITSR